MSNASTFLSVGNYVFGLEHFPPSVIAQLRILYQGAIYDDCDQPVDFWLESRATSPFRRVLFPQRAIYADGTRLFNPVLAKKLLPSVEWGMNWCIASFDVTKLIIHAGVVVKKDTAILLPAAQGSGKSTLSTFLGHSGWNMYSDELAIIDLVSCEVTPLYKPSSLKNNSIALVKSWFPNAVVSAITTGTQKGDIAHVKVHSHEDYLSFSPAKVSGVVFPRFRKNAACSVRTLTKAQGLVQLNKHCFNYSTLGVIGFDTLVALANSVDFSILEYSDIAEAQSFLETLI